MKKTYLLSLALFLGHISFSSTSPPVNANTSGITPPKQNALPFPGASLNFDGINDLVGTGSGIANVLSTKNQITVEAWVYPTAELGNGAIVGNLSYPSSNGEVQFSLRRDDDKQYVFFVDDNVTLEGVYSGPGTLVPNTWQHVAGVWDGAVLSIYIDGVLKKTLGGVTGPHLFTSTNGIAIGGNGEGQFFEGNIDEVRIWSRALCPSEILADKNCEVPTIGTGLLGNYHFNQGVGDDTNTGIVTLNDASGNNNNGTLYQFALTGTTSNWSLKAGVVSGTSCTPYNGISSVSISSQTNVSCFGKTDGAATVAAIGISPSYSWAPSGGTAATATNLAAGTYTCTVTSACGGSLLQVVTIGGPSAIVYSQTLSLCAGDSVKVGTKFYKTTGTYTDILTAKNGCDSTVTTNLTVKPLIVTSQTFNLCAGESVTVGTNVYNVTGVYTDKLKAKDNCDSTVTTNLTVKPAIATSQTFLLCAGESVTVGTNVYNVTGVYTDKLKAKDNCDSTVTTHLTIKAAIATSQTFLLCAGESVTVGTNVYNTTGVYTDKLKAKDNCDSTVTTNLTVKPAIATSQSFTICTGQSITVGTNVYTTTGVYTDKLKAKDNCDSTVTTNLTVLAGLDVSITTNGNVITANGGGALYQWLDCTLNTPIAGQTNQSFTATANGSYAVIVTIGNCSDTSICQPIIITGIDNAAKNIPVEIYPNPSTGIVNMELSSSQQVVIFNGIGQVIYTAILNTGKHVIDLQKEPAGLYTVQLLGNNTTQRFKLMKE